MSQPNFSSPRIFILLVLSFAIITGILEISSTNHTMGQRATGPGGIDTSAPGATTGPGGIEHQHLVLPLVQRAY